MANRTRTRVRRLLLALLLLAALSAAVSCGLGSGPINDGETYLNGSWYNEELRVGYNFFDNGTGFMFIGTETQIPLRYGIYMGNLYMDTDGDVSVLPFGVEEDHLLIGNLPYLPVGPDDSVVPVSESSLPAPADNSGAKRWILIGAGVITALLAIAILIRYFRRRKPSGGTNERKQ